MWKENKNNFDYENYLKYCPSAIKTKLNIVALTSNIVRRLQIIIVLNIPRFKQEAISDEKVITENE